MITKLWNVARFSERFLENYQITTERREFTPTDRWLLARLASLLSRVTALFRSYEYAAAKSEIEHFFWHDLTDNYLEMCKERLYGPASLLQEGARYTLYHVLLSILKLFAPFLPYVTEEIYRGLFAIHEGSASIHLTHWPIAHATWASTQAEESGEILIAVATAVRRYKSEQSMALGTELSTLFCATQDTQLLKMLEAAQLDILSVTRVRKLCIGVDLSFNAANEIWQKEGVLRIGLVL
ncbi:MAG: class I tRNA ligase family protein [Ktedonobacteraceae bacterium]